MNLWDAHLALLNSAIDCLERHDPKLVNKVARALCDAHGDPDLDWDQMIPAAIAALDAVWEYQPPVVLRRADVGAVINEWDANDMFSDGWRDRLADAIHSAGRAVTAARPCEPETPQ